MQSSTFNEANPSAFPLFTTVDKVRSQFAEGTAIMIAIGGWGDTAGFSKAAETESNRKLFAKNIKTMVDYTGADGISIEPHSNFVLAY
jgi:GH18 family chitinase